jgi:hypothetical protein
VPYQLYHGLSQSSCDTWHFASGKDEIYTVVANLHCASVVSIFQTTLGRDTTTVYIR